MSIRIANAALKQEDKIAGYVIETYDYDQFKHLIGNRALLQSRKARIMRSVKANGQIFSPILVNDNMEVIDGQGRLEVFRELGKPVYYIVSPGLTRQDCIVFNSTTTSWNLKDYIQSYVDMGDVNYIRFNKLMTDHKKADTVAIIFTINGNVTGFRAHHGKTSNECIKNGELRLDEETYLRSNNMLSYGERFTTVFRGAGKAAYLIQAAIFCGYYCKPDSMEAVFEKWERNANLSSMMRPIASVIDAVKYIEDTYNYRSRTEVVSFENAYKEYVRQNSINNRKNRNS